MRRSASQPIARRGVPTGPYEVLGIGLEATAEEIKRAYKCRALQWHPDKHPPEVRQEREQQFKALSGAYETLRHPEKRRQYDQMQGTEFEAPSSRSAGTAASSRRGSGAGARRAASVTRRNRSHSCGSAASYARSEKSQPAPESRPPSAGHAWWRPPSFTDVRSEKPQPAPESPESRPLSAGHAWWRPPSFADVRPLAFGRRPATAPAACPPRRLASQRLTCELGSVEVRADLSTIAGWVLAEPSHILEVKGCRQTGEEEMIAMGRGIQALAVLTGLYSVPAERCRQAAALGEGFAGIEVRAMTNIGLEGFFKDGRSVELENCTAKDVASAVSECSMGVLDSQKRLYVEVRYAAAASRLASRRLTAVLKFLSAGGLPRRRLRGQIRAGQENKVEFYIFEEFPESDL